MQVSFQQNEGSRVTEAFQNNTRGRDYREKPSPRPHHQAPELPGWTSLIMLSATAKWLQGRAGQSTPLPQPHGHSPSLGKHNLRQPRCSEKARVTEKALHKKQLCQLDPEKGSRHPWQCRGRASVCLGSPCVCPQEMAWSK